MNLKEGMRRTGIMLGLLGACTGGVLAYADASPLWQRWREHKRFQALLTTPTVRRATGTEWFARHSPGNDKWCDVDPALPKLPRGFKLDGPCYETNYADKGTLHWIDLAPWERDWSKENKPVPGQIVTTMLRLESFAPDRNRDGIACIHYDVSGAVTSLELATGEKLAEPPPPSFVRTFVFPLLVPLVGFLLPWGVTKSIAWIATGFTAPKGA